MRLSMEGERKLHEIIFNSSPKYFAQEEYEMIREQIVKHFPDSNIKEVRIPFIPQMITAKSAFDSEQVEDFNMEAIVLKRVSHFDLWDISGKESI